MEVLAEVAEKAKLGLELRGQIDAESEDARPTLIKGHRESRLPPPVELVLVPYAALRVRLSKALRECDPIVVVEAVVDEPTHGRKKWSQIVLK